MDKKMFLVTGLTKHDAPDFAAIESLLNQGNHLR
jgi:hypothetical protein